MWLKQSSPKKKKKSGYFSSESWFGWGGGDDRRLLCSGRDVLGLSSVTALFNWSVCVKSSLLSMHYSTLLLCGLTGLFSVPLIPPVFLLCSCSVPPVFLLPPSFAHTVVLYLCVSPLFATLTPVQSVQLSLLGPPLTTLKSDQSVTGVSHQSHLLDPSYE